LIGDPGFFSSLILKEGNIPWIPHQAQNNKKYFLDSRFRGNDNTSVILEIFYQKLKVTVILEGTTTIIPNLIGDPDNFSFYLKNKYFLDSRFRGNDKKRGWE
jgi:hypothetical protein